MAGLIARPVRFGDDLAYEDRKTLRTVVRKVHAKWFKDEPSNRDCDRLIDALGPGIQAKLLKAKTSR